MMNGHEASPDSASTIGVITNPNSKKNKRFRRRPEHLETIVAGQGVVVQTRNVDEIEAVIERFRQDRITYWVSDGGDGALHWMLNSTFQILKKQEPRPNLCEYEFPIAVPTNGGTIDFVAHKAGIKGQAEEILRALVGVIKTKASLPLVPVDSLYLFGQRRVNGQLVPFEKIGFATAIAGIGARFFDKYYATPRPGPMHIIKIILLVALSSLFRLPLINSIPFIPKKWAQYSRDILVPTKARVVADGKVLPCEYFRAIHAGSININLGDVIKIFNFAQSPGVLHFQAGDISVPTFFRNLPNILTGRAINAKGIYDAPGHELDVYPEEAQGLSIIIDGEAYQDITEIHVRLGPKILIPQIRVEATWRSRLKRLWQLCS
jgi:diacylglycerol kinase family enzyme